MRKLGKRLLSFLLAISLMVSLIPAAFAAETTDTGTDADMEITEEVADQVIEQMFGEADGTATKTDAGYEYMVPVEAFSSLTDSIEAAAEENAEESAVEEETSNKLPADYVDDSNEVLYQMLAELENLPAPMSEDKDTKVEVVFIIDSTGSMGSYITYTKNNVAEFARYLAEKDITLRLGLIDYQDITHDGIDSTVVHSANHSNWMDVTSFISELSKVKADDGGDSPETPIDALAHLTNGTMAWSSDAYKFAVLITDAGYKVNNNHGIASMDEMIDQLRAADIQVTTITRSSYATTYGNLAGYTGGIQVTLSSSFASLLKDYADSIIGGAQETQDYTLRVVEETTQLPVKNAQVSWSGGSGTTNADGMVIITTRSNPIRSLKIACSGYTSLSQNSLELEKGGMTTVTMEVDDSDSSSVDGVPVLKKSHFQDPESGEAKFAGPKLNLLGKDFNLLEKASVAVDFDLFGANVNISHDRENRKYNVIIAKEFEGKNKADGKEWQKSFQEYKALVKTFTWKSAKEINNQFRSLKKQASSKADFVFPVDVQVGGYASVSYSSGGLSWDTIEGGVIVGVSTKDINLVNYPLPPAPYVFFKVTFKMEGKAEFAFVTIESTGKVKLGVSSTITAEPSLKGTVNLGVDRLASVGGGLKGKLNTQIKIPFSELSDGLKVALTGSFILELKLLGFSIDEEFPFAELDIYPGKRSRAAEPLAVIEASDFKRIERPSDSGIMPLADMSGFDYYQANAYADAAPQMVHLNNGSWLLVWLGAAADRSDNDMSALYYSVSADGSTWGEAKMVNDDGTGDFMPALTLAGNGAPILAWQNSSKVYADAELDLETRAQDIEVAVSVFDPETGTFGDAVSITNAENSMCEMAVHVASQGTGAAVYWLENTANSLLLSEGTTSIYSSSYDAETETWSAPVCQVSNISGLNKFAAGEVGGDSFVAYTVNSYKYIYYRNITDNRSSSRSAASEPTDLQIAGGKLYWSDNNGLRSWNQSTTRTENSSLANVNCTIVPGTGTSIALFRNSEGLVSEYSASICSGSTFSDPVPVTSYGMMLGTPSAVIDGSTLRFAVGRTAVDADTNTMGTSDLIVDSHTFGANIVVSETAFTSYFADMSAETVDISVDIANQGLAASGALKAAFYRGGEMVGESALRKVNPTNPSSSSSLSSIAAGEVIWATAKYPLPEDRSEHELQIQITDSAGTSVYGTAIATIPGAACDLTVENTEVARTDTGAIITATVTNNGLAAAEEVTLELTQERSELKLRASIGNLDVGASQDVSFQVSSETLTAMHAYDYKRFTVTASTTSGEILTGNNSDDTLLAPICVSGIVLKGEDAVSLEVGDSYTYTYTILPEDAPLQSAVWMSSDVAVASVKDGVVTAQKPGTATITVLTFDQEGNKLTDTATVTVAGKANVSVTGVQVSAPSSSISIGKTTVLSASVLPENATNQRVFWTTPTPELVSLEASEDSTQVTVTALAEGTAVIAARSADGDYTDSVELTVLPGKHVTRVFGRDRVATAIQAAEQLRSVLGVSQFDAMIITSGDNFADALAGSYLAAGKSAPILLSLGDPAKNLTYIQEKLAPGGTIYILGGTSAVPQEVEDLLIANGYAPIRLSGKGRLDTNIRILEEAGITGGEILVATGWKFADSLSASATGKPILLVDSNNNVLSENQKDFLSALSDVSFTIIGGEGAVSGELETQLSDYGAVNRISGKNREMTSQAVANQYCPSASVAVLAYSQNFPDGLCGGPLAYALGAPLLLVNQGAESAAQSYVSANNIQVGYVMGGSAVVSDSSIRTVFSMTSEDPIG